MMLIRQMVRILLIVTILLRQIMLIVRAILNTATLKLVLRLKTYGVFMGPAVDPESSQTELWHLLKRITRQSFKLLCMAFSTFAASRDENLVFSTANASCQKGSRARPVNTC